MDLIAQRAAGPYHSVIPDARVLAHPRPRLRLHMEFPHQVESNGDKPAPRFVPPLSPVSPLCSEAGRISGSQSPSDDLSAQVTRVLGMVAGGCQRYVSGCGTANVMQVSCLGCFV